MWNFKYSHWLIELVANNKIGLLAYSNLMYDTGHKIADPFCVLIHINIFEHCFDLLRNKHFESSSSDNCDYFLHIIWVVWHYNTIWWPKSLKYLYICIFCRLSVAVGNKFVIGLIFLFFFIKSYDYMVIIMKIFGLVNN